MFIYLKNFLGLDIIDISEYLGGSTLKNIFGFIFILYFLVTSSILVREFAEGLKVVYYPMTAIIYVVCFFVLSAFISNTFKFGSTIKTNLIITTFVFCSILFLFIGNFQKYSFQRIFPILGKGFTNTFIIGLNNIYAFEGIVFLYFLPPLLKKPEQFKKVAISSIIFHIIYLILAVASILFMFSSVGEANDIMPLYSAARFLQFGSFFERLESLFLLIWIMAFGCYLNICVKFAILIFKKISKVKYTNSLAAPFCLLVFGISLIPKNYSYTEFFETHIYPYLVIGFVFFFCISLLIFANLKKNKSKQVGD